MTSDSAHAQTTTPANRSRLALFATVHLVILLAGVAWAMMRVRETAAEKQLPPLREKPIIVRPLYDRPEVISDDKLQKVLHHLRPRLRGPKPRINHVDHALRFWGYQATFQDPECLSGKEMRQLLTDHRDYSKKWGAKIPPLHVTSNYGLRTRVQEGLSTSSHVDHTVSTLAEIGTPSSFPIYTPTGETTFRALLEHAIRNFSLNQLEYEWTATVFALYMPTNREWQTTEGQWISFDRLAERIMRQEYLQGVCYGNHRLFSLTILVRVDEIEKILSPDTRRKCLEHLQEATRRLVKNISKEGYWDQNWEGSEWSESWNVTPALSRRILATGHALEWWAMAPKEVLPPDETIVSAAKWLSDEILKMSDEQVKTNYTFLTHAGRALALWRGKFPHEIYQPIPVKPKTGIKK
ncbi:MAG: hypothetical protein Tsb009_22720 [Planctomycetaceae bacterium]